MVFLRSPISTDLEKIKIAYQNSQFFHQPWVYPPIDFDQYLEQEHRYLLCLKNTKEIVGAFHLSGIVRGAFQSCFLGYEVFYPYQQKGLMTLGMKKIIHLAFKELNLHRIEANIQPDNIASITLVKKSGFTREGFSKAYLYIGNQGWKDHERWAILNPDWESV